MADNPITSLAVVLATDHYETIRPVIQHLRKQTIREQLEVVIVGAYGISADVPRSELGEFGRFEVLEVESLLPIGPSRAAGVRSCRSPLVFIGETHTYAHPTWAETLIRTHGSKAGIVPGFGNANPKTALSWAIFLLDYGQFFHLVPARETDVAPSHNGSFKRDALLSLGPALDDALTQGDRLTAALREAGHRVYFEPEARIDHLNIARPAPWIEERFLCGRLISGRRAERWPLHRRVVYFCGSPLIPGLLLFRRRKGLWLAWRSGQLPAGTIPAIVAGVLISTVGEMVGFVLGPGPNSEPKMMEYELHKVRYASRGNSHA
jgi:hypothetical protein